MQINVVKTMMHISFMVLASPYQVTQVAQNLSYTSFFIPQKTCISRPYCIWFLRSSQCSYDFIKYHFKVTVTLFSYADLFFAQKLDQFGVSIAN